MIKLRRNAEPHVRQVQLNVRVVKRAEREAEPPEDDSSTVATVSFRVEVKNHKATTESEARRNFKRLFGEETTDEA